MTDLVACLSTGKGTWINVLQLVKKEDFENVFLIVNNWAKENLKLERENLILEISGFGARVVDWYPGLSTGGALIGARL